MDMQQVCAEALEEVDGALGCIVMDMQTGLTVAARYRPGSSFNDSTINLVSVVSANMFAGRLIRQFEGALAVEPAPGFVREVQMTTANTNQFMAAIPDWSNGVFVLVTDKTVSLGLGWMAVHRVIERIQSNVLQGAANDSQGVGQPPPRTDLQVVGQMPPHLVAQHAPPAQDHWAQPSPAPYGGVAPAPGLAEAGVGETDASPVPYGGTAPSPTTVPLQPLEPQAMPPQAAGSAQASRPSARAAAPSALGQAKQPKKKSEERPVAMGARANFMSRKKK